MTKVALIREGKVPQDKRVPLTPSQCVELMATYSGLKVVAQKSEIRCIPDEDYAKAGVEVVSDVSDCDILMGVKEVPVEQLVPNKTYLFFSHVIKKQPHNRKLLKAILEKNINMVDYECLKYTDGSRILGFGRWAGVVGCYNGFLAYGKVTDTYFLKPANRCANFNEVKTELLKVRLPKNFKIVMTGGTGRVGKGALEIMDTLNLKRVDKAEFLTKEFNEPVYTVLEALDYYERNDNTPFDKKSFYNKPEGHHSVFLPFGKTANMYVSCHFWDSRAPIIFTKEDMKNQDWKINYVADVSCDVDGPIGCTIRSSTIAEPIYAYDKNTEKEVSIQTPGAVTVMAVDNLPCELPKDASADFGRALVDKVFPHLLGEDKENIINHASIAIAGNLNTPYLYLEDYVNHLQK